MRMIIDVILVSIVSQASVFCCSGKRYSATIVLRPRNVQGLHLRQWGGNNGHFQGIGFMLNVTAFWVLF